MNQQTFQHLADKLNAIAKINASEPATFAHSETHFSFFCRKWFVSAQIPKNQKSLKRFEQTIFSLFASTILDSTKPLEQIQIDLASHSSFPKLFSLNLEHFVVFPISIVQPQRQLSTIVDMILDQRERSRRFFSAISKESSQRLEPFWIETRFAQNPCHFLFLVRLSVDQSKTEKVFKSRLSAILLPDKRHVALERKTAEKLIQEIFSKCQPYLQYPLTTKEAIDAVLKVKQSLDLSAFPADSKFIVDFVKKRDEEFSISMKLQTQDFDFFLKFISALNFINSSIEDIIN